MFADSLDVIMKGRKFKIESLKILVSDNEEDFANGIGMTIFAYKVWEGRDILNAEELLNNTFDFYSSGEDAVDGGFAWLKKYLK